MHSSAEPVFLGSGGTNPSAEFRLDGRSAIITGAANGIGYVIAAEFARAGATAHIVDRDGDAASAGADAIAAGYTLPGGPIYSYACDVSDAAEVDLIFGKLIAEHGVHILVNNAGIAGIGRVDTTATEDFDRVFNAAVARAAAACNGRRRAR